MPRRAGYFALAYNWDHHCHALLNSIAAGFRGMVSELNRLERLETPDLRLLLDYYKKWHYNRELYDIAIKEIDHKIFVINDLGYRGYGVNIDLLRALEAARNEYAGSVHRLLCETFNKHIHAVKKAIKMPQGFIDSTDSRYIITGLCRKLKLKPDENIPCTAHSTAVNLGHYFRVVSEKTPVSANTAIFQKLFLNMGASSITIMKGSRGYHDTLPPQALKIIGNRNFTEMFKEIFSQLDDFTDIGIDLLKRIHFVLSKGIDPDAGNFRDYDFPDRNGVTVDFGNFNREIGDLAQVLDETAQSFEDLPSFISNLSRSYYMIIGIHPFRDSNGRVGRCFLNYMLLKKCLPPVSFANEHEIFALPRYGGTMEDMNNYIKTRIAKAVDSYFFERRRLESSGFLFKRIHNVSFDSGFHFRQIEGSPEKIEVNFTAYLIDDRNPLSWQFQEQCSVVLPDEQLLRNITIYCGFSRAYRSEWEHVFSLENDFSIKEIESDVPGIRAFDIDFIVKLRDKHRGYDYFNCSVASGGCGRMFNNKGLNYSYKLEKKHSEKALHVRLKRKTGHR